MEKIGFIGLGIMGKPMARHLMKAGYSLHILSSSASARELKLEGASIMNSPLALAEQVDVVITMLPDSPEVETVVLQSNGVMAGLKEGSLFIDMSTIAPQTSIKLYEAFQQKGVEVLDAPVSGGQAGAEGATLSIMAGGNESAFKRALPVF